MQSTAKNLMTEPKPSFEPDPLFTRALVGWFKIADKGGLGTVALQDIPKGTVIERCPVIIMPADELKRPDGSEVELGSYAFHWGDPADEVSVECAVVKGGLLALANHSDNASSDIRQLREEKMIEWFATRDIKKGEEVTIDYDTDLWFENREKA